MKYLKHRRFGLPHPRLRRMVQLTADSGRKKIIVTGGTGMVGQAIKWVIENESDPRFGKCEDEEWIFLGSKDGNLKYDI